METKSPVRLRRKHLKDGSESLYLDIYEDGYRSYEFLKLYLVPERNEADRRRNRQTMQIAETVRARRLVEVQSSSHGLRAAGRGPTLEEFLAAEGRPDYRTLLYNVRKHRIARVRLGDITVRDYDSFVRSLSGLAPNTRKLDAALLKSALNRAARQGLADIDTRRMKVPRGCETDKCYLTAEELRRLAATPCRREDVRRLFFFSALTGLRYSDCIRITWGDVQRDAGGWRVAYRQTKTRNIVYVDLNGEAVSLMGEPGAADAAVFGVIAHPTVRYTLRRWAAAAGIHKHVTFHTARHTFATLSLATGTDIYTVSRMLGHKSVATTQIYAKIMDAARREAVERLPKIL